VGSIDVTRRGYKLGAQRTEGYEICDRKLHSGVPVTYKRLKQHFAWNGMKTVVQDFVQSCLICQ
jgi:hypothetical protein